MKSLAAKGVKDSFLLSEDGKALRHPEGDFPYPPELLEIVKTYRFEGNSDPSDESALFHLRTSDGKEGLMITTYGTYASEDSAKFNEFIVAVPANEQ